MLGFRGWLVVAGMALLGAGGAVGFLCGAYFTNGAVREDVDDEVPLAGPQRDVLHHIDNDIVFNRLGLSPEQRLAADHILSECFREFQRLRQEQYTLGESLEGRLVDLLGPEQHERLRGIIREINLPEVASRASQKLEWYRVELKLSGEQQDRVFAVLVNDQFRKNELFRECSAKKSRGEEMCREEISQRYQELNGQRAQELRPILSDEQWNKFQEMDKKRGQFFTGRGGKGGGKGPSNERFGPRVGP